MRDFGLCPCGGFFEFHQITYSLPLHIYGYMKNLVKWLTSSPIIRWVLVLPTSILAPVILITAFRLIFFGLSMLDWRITPPDERGLLGLLVEYAGLAVLFVWAGAFMAPTKKKATSLVLAGFFYLYFFFELFLVISFPESSPDRLPILYAVTMVIAASVAARMVFKDDTLSFLRGRPE